MIVYGFIGLSGTGKSFQVISLCHQLKINDFIDDGLYIHDGLKVAGISSKYETNKISAVKRAIFLDPVHLLEVQQAIGHYRPEKLLVVGTSERMVRQITEKLGVPQPNQWIDINDISTADDIQKAMYTRKMYGQHVIPIPHIQVEKDLFSQLIEKVKSVVSPGASQLGENTIVYPVFQDGKIYVSNLCLREIINYTLKKNIDVQGVRAIVIPAELDEPVTLHLSLNNHKPIPEVCRQIQKDVRAILDQMLNVTLPYANILVIGIRIEK